MSGVWIAVLMFVVWIYGYFVGFILGIDAERRAVKKSQMRAVVAQESIKQALSEK